MCVFGNFYCWQKIAVSGGNLPFDGINCRFGDVHGRLGDVYCFFGDKMPIFETIFSLGQFSAIFSNFDGNVFNF